jgi:hypothetical protein
MSTVAYSTTPCTTAPLPNDRGVSSSTVAVSSYGPLTIYRASPLPGGSMAKWGKVHISPMSSSIDSIGESVQFRPANFHPLSTPCMTVNMARSDMATSHCTCFIVTLLAIVTPGKPCSKPGTRKQYPLHHPRLRIPFGGCPCSPPHRRCGHST